LRRAARAVLLPHMQGQVVATPAAKRPQDSRYVKETARACHIKYKTCRQTSHNSDEQEVQDTTCYLTGYLLLRCRAVWHCYNSDVTDLCCRLTWVAAQSRSPCSAVSTVVIASDGCW
jgi:hypothetical protein